jgi:hypothetical protein
MSSLIIAPLCVAHQLYTIFTLLGAPQILQCDNGREFTDRILQEIFVLWPGLTIIHGRPRHPESQGSVERANCDVERMIRAWLLDKKNNNKPSGFAMACFEISMKKTSRRNSTINDIPYKLVFGQDIMTCMDDLSLGEDICGKITDEEEMYQLGLLPLDEVDQIVQEQKYNDLYFEQSGYTELGWTPRDNTDSLSNPMSHGHELPPAPTDESNAEGVDFDFYHASFLMQIGFLNKRLIGINF